MPRFAANLSMMFSEVAFPDRFEAAAKAGFKAVECQFPYDFDKKELRDRLRAHELTMVLHNLPAGDWNAGERGIACLPGRNRDFQASVELAVEYATTLGCQQVNCLSGILPDGVEREQALDVLVHNLTFAATEFKKSGIRLLIEPINNKDVPGFLLNTSADGIGIIEAVGSENLFLQYDIYHMQRMEGELANTIDRLLPRIAHMQLADTPGRHEPGSGEINFNFLLNHIDDTGYDGWIGCEYLPANGTVAGLGWMDKFSGGGA